MKSRPLFDYKGVRYPEYLKSGNAMRFIRAIASEFCSGKGIDVGAGDWRFPGAMPVELRFGGDAMNVPYDDLNYVFSSHCLEHLNNPVRALEHWQTLLRPGGCLFLYLPHPDMVYWRPQHCRKHLHSWRPDEMAHIVRDVGYVDVIHSERDMAWSFAVVAWKSKIHDVDNPQP